MTLSVASRADATPAERRGLEPRRFRPRLSVGYHQDLHSLVAEMQTRDFDDRIGLLRSAIDAAEAWRMQLRDLGVGPDDLKPTITYLATLRVLRDLSLQGWMPGLDDDGIFVFPHPLLPQARIHPTLRQSFATRSGFALADQLLSPSVAAFVRKMERQGIASVFADGPELADRIERASTAALGMQSAIRPVLELVDPEVSDPTTAIRLQDIWRYSRLQWSIPYQSTPGRNLHYLIRDDAGPNRPVIGIAALGNAILGLNQRDDALGWSVKALARRLDAASSADRRRIARHFAQLRARRGLQRLRRRSGNRGPGSSRRGALPAADRGVRGRRPQECAQRCRRPAHTGIRRHPGSAQPRRRRRRRSRRLGRDRPHAPLSPQASRKPCRHAPCDRRVRGGRARRRSACSQELLWTEDGRRAVEIVLRRIKQQAIAENVMEIITCGAVSPYQQLLAASWSRC